MRIFVAGATGAIGRLLVPKLLANGHELTGLTRSEERGAKLREQGVEPVVADVFDAEAVRAGIERAQPEVVVHELTDIPPALNPRTYEKDMAGNDRIRVEGTRSLVEGAKAAGASRIVAQSISFAYAPRGDRTLRVEDDELWLDAPSPFRRSTEALHSLESQVLGAEGIEGFVLRYGFFYGPGTAYARDGASSWAIRKRKFPIVAGGTAQWSFIHVEDAATATVRAIEADAPAGIYNIVDDDPAPVSEWLPALAEALGAKPPRKIPGWIARFAAGPFAVMSMTQLQAASNQKAKRELGWSPAIPTWREGFRSGL